MYQWPILKNNKGSILTFNGVWKYVPASNDVVLLENFKLAETAICTHKQEVASFLMLVKEIDEEIAFVRLVLDLLDENQEFIEQIGGTRVHLRRLLTLREQHQKLITLVEMEA